MATLFLLLSIAFSTFINLIFRWFKVYNVNKFHAIVVNYLVCFIIGILLSENRSLLSNMHADWFLYCIGLGVVFVAIFFSMALTTEKMGISVTAVSGKMSVVVPILFAYLFTNENISVLFAAGIILSLFSIYFISVKKNLVVDKKHLFLPLIVFLGGGFIDTSLQVLERNYGAEVSMDTITYSIFLGAFLAGSLLFVVKTKANVRAIEKKSVIAGVLLGIPNYFSIFFLLSAISNFQNKSSLVFGVNNIGVVLFSTLLSVLIFKENLSQGNKLGLGFAILSIIIIAYAS